MGLIYRGILEPILNWQEWSWDQSVGYTLDQEYQGLDYAAMTRLANYFQYYGVSTRVRFQAGKAILSTRDATGNYTVDKWEMNVDQTQPSVFENDLFNSLMNQAVDKSTAITKLRAALQNSDPTTATDQWNTLVADPTFQAALGPAFGVGYSTLIQLQQYFDDYNLGVTNFVSGRYTLRHTTNAPNRWTANVADFNVEKIYTIGQLLSEVQNSNLWILPMPGYLAYKIANYAVPNLRGPNYMWGALKERSSASTAANNRIDIVTEYLIDQINTNLYYTL
jgi:hypothetical protein